MFKEQKTVFLAFSTINMNYFNLNGIPNPRITSEQK